MRKMASTTVYLTPAQLSELNRRSVATKVPMAVMIREAIDAWLLANPLTQVIDYPPEHWSDEVHDG